MTDEREMRQTLASALIDAAATDDRIVVLEADLMSCHATKKFKEAYPDRFVNVGIAEQNLIGVAAGLAAMGKVPFAYSFGPFATRRCFDQIFISVAYSGLNVKIVGTDPGVTAEANGGTHMPFEDMALMRAVPNMYCFEPTDAAMLEKAVPSIINSGCPVYIRMFRKKAETVYDSNFKFELGKAYRLTEGKDVTLFASGIMVSRALEAAKLLKNENIYARVVNVCTWKPLDEKEIVSSAQETGAAVTCENHNVNGGLASAIAGLLAMQYPIPMEMVGVFDKFGQVGKNAYLSEQYGLTVNDIVEKAKNAVARKTK